ncbi:zinc-dependent alcohol dehydrogenase family protein [Burkholderia pseudomultivorans]|uniref:alcohol dehydrogenase n=1 Tax=Burkholderia pseudomultivorans TaxID=1207504 RepID=A0ABU2ED55_9BURK|nr:zinc-dependent alcohol dehydrogenase family protein [Burkholderia pseudomultivorans]MDR8727955.1 putative alcohol dehydrogenase AdhA [Burkholderia pseudomultivorans]MDR8734066.1 putative alcohol dehydrogenase AdhA [Burkholderia pseudomultivorans]MDR8743708.1 putative alcohol dehydrogenase AdhA [Burkholderia pseudomultivorans]MDR8757825.1 putative alcohol dehydrogenase AdhA [Burkholderia pseudomultivorans]MDR8779744.1 putative alcohol dehydrogenase AdhA [Burkholderia pseudomultivorans]
MRAQVYDGRSPALTLRELPDPSPGQGQILIDVHACGVCRTDLHVVDGDLTEPKRPVIPGHEIVGTVAALGDGVHGFALGERVGVPWLGHTCGRCAFCAAGRENLCDAPGFTGYTIDGGYAERTVADARYCLRVPPGYDDVHAAPLLCAGLIGYRTLTLAGNAQRIGLYGFGAAAHIVAQVARHEGRHVHAFTRPGDTAAQQLALRLGANWAGGSDQPAPEPLDAALIFAPVGALVPLALAAVVKGGSVVCGGIHMSDIPSFPYALLWEERRLLSVANLTRADGEAFMALAGRIPLEIEATRYALADANRALDDLRAGRLSGAAVLTMR